MYSELGRYGDGSRSPRRPSNATIPFVWEEVPGKPKSVPPAANQSASVAVDYRRNHTSADDSHPSSSFCSDSSITQSTTSDEGFGSIVQPKLCLVLLEIGVHKSYYNLVGFLKSHSYLLVCKAFQSDLFYLWSVEAT